jgi:hypothetical protein
VLEALFNKNSTFFPVGQPEVLERFAAITTASLEAQERELAAFRKDLTTMSRNNERLDQQSNGMQSLSDRVTAALGAASAVGHAAKELREREQEKLEARLAIQEQELHELRDTMRSMRQECQKVTQQLRSPRSPSPRSGPTSSTEATAVEALGSNKASAATVVANAAAGIATPPIPSGPPVAPVPLCRVIVPASTTANPSPGPGSSLHCMPQTWLPSGQYVSSCGRGNSSPQRLASPMRPRQGSAFGAAPAAGQLVQPPLHSPQVPRHFPTPSMIAGLSLTSTANVLRTTDPSMDGGSAALATPRGSLGSLATAAAAGSPTAARAGAVTPPPSRPLRVGSPGFVTSHCDGFLTPVAGCGISPAGGPCGPVVLRATSAKSPAMTLSPQSLCSGAGDTSGTTSPTRTMPRGGVCTPVRRQSQRAASVCSAFCELATDGVHDKPRWPQFR